MFDIVAGFLDEAERSTIKRILGNVSIPVRLIFVLDRIDSENAFGLLRKLRLFDDNRISFFAIVRQDVYVGLSQDTRKMIGDLGFESIYLPCLWEDKVQFIDSLLKPPFVLDERMKGLGDFKNHIAFVTRGAPGDAVRKVSSNAYCEYRHGRLTLNLDKVRDWDLIQYNAERQQILTRNWSRILEYQFIGEEERDYARRGVYEILDWVDRQAEFIWDEIEAYSAQAQTRISPSEGTREDTVRALIGVLIEEGYLIELGVTKSG